MAGPLDIQLPKLELKTWAVTIIGDSPLICHAWSVKAKRAMLDSQMKKARPKKDAKSPEEDYEASLYKLPDGKYGFPAVAFKSAIVGACRFVDGVKMTELRGALHILGEMVTIEGEPSPREDMVRLNGIKADIRYRGEFKEWRATLLVQFNASIISPEQIGHLLTLAGFGVGVGEWRPERNGSYGRFHVATEEVKA
jgi:hypothetical protein